MLKKEIGIIGLGKMGGALSLNLRDRGWRVDGFNRTSTVTDLYKKENIEASYSFSELVSKLESPRIIWIMLTAGEATQNTIFGENGLINYLNKGDTIVEGGNAFYKNDLENAERLKQKGINYIDVGVSGGPNGARNGACCMIGGEKENFLNLETLFKDISLENGYKFFEGHGAGHFVKMVHNGIEYGMMQSIAEGFNLMKKSEFNLNMQDIAEIYSNGSVIESRLISWASEGFKKYGNDLETVSGSVASNGEGAWTVNVAKEKNIEVKAIKTAVDFRIESQNNPSFTGKILSMMRGMFGGHKID